ncbi:hypothetical protein KFE25_011542 [Diacronema lutheri]|uniref:Uncharacterized protein n=2 Tax=Diacronema lutheri TaxID=2081491 RepID=A0A8J5XIX6_DIALT|nr:hypothetical protein KFE25_011542 [Diacronema lutheri]
MAATQRVVISSLTDNVRTGDLVFFNQRCDSLLDAPRFAVVCAFRKYGLSHSGAGVFDHAGVVVRNPRTDVPWLLEGSSSAVRLTPFEERAMEAAKTASEVVLVRLETPRTPALEARAQGYVAELAGGERGGRTVSPSLAQLWRVYDGSARESRPPPAASGSADPLFGAALVAGLYARLGLVSREDGERQWTPLGLRSRAFGRCLRRGAKLHGEIHILQQSAR